MGVTKSRNLPITAVLKAAVQSASVMFTGDVLAQTIERKCDSKNCSIDSSSFPPLSSSPSSELSESVGNLNATKPFDFRRSARWFTLGLTLHGPFFYFAMKRVDMLFGAVRTAPVVLMKTVASQFCVFPPYLCLLFPYLAFLEGHVKSVGDCGRELKKNFVSTFTVGCLFWPAANLLNFFLLPSNYRVLYLAAAGCMWNTYLSRYLSRTKEENLCVRWAA